MEFQVRLIDLDCLWGTNRHAGHTPDAIVLSDRISFIGIVLPLFLNSAPGALARSVSQLYGGYIVFGSIPLKYLNRTSFNTCAISNTRIPVDCHHSAVYSQRNLFFSLCRIG